MNYYIGQGTSIVKEFETFEEMIEFHKNMNSMDRHFSRLYDCIKRRSVPGWKAQYNYFDESMWDYTKEAAV